MNGNVAAIKPAVAATKGRRFHPPSGKDLLWLRGEPWADGLRPQRLGRPGRICLKLLLVPGTSVPHPAPRLSAGPHPPPGLSADAPPFPSRLELLVGAPGAALPIGLTAFLKLPRRLRILPPSPSTCLSFHSGQTCVALRSLPCFLLRPPPLYALQASRRSSLARLIL